MGGRSTVLNDDIMNSLLERLLNFLQRRLPCVTSIQEQDPDGSYVRLSGNLEPEPTRQAPGRPTTEGPPHRQDSSAAKTSALPNREPRANRLSVQLEHDTWPARLRIQSPLAVQHRRLLKPSATRPPTPFVESAAAAQHLAPGRRCCEVRV
ncbi:hypothetical protein MTO96_048518 [Rhipicephalus appendiculatus]